MKRVGELFHKIVEFENLLLAAKKAFKGKKNKQRVACFYFNLEKELLSIREELLNRTYRPYALRTFTIHEPKERIIGASEFRDRVVHHAVCNIIEPFFERGYIYHSYACRRKKGTHRAIAHAQRCCRGFQYYLKMDVRKYFENIDHEILKSILRRKFKDPNLLWLLELIIDRSNNIECETNEIRTDCMSKGIPIGSLTSQHFANIYLDQLDHYVKDELGVKGYVRYMDDFILFDDDKSKLHLLHLQIAEFLKNKLSLEAKEEVTIIAPVSQGLPFLGFRIFPQLIRVKNENKTRLFRKLKLRTEEYRNGIIDNDTYSQSLRSITEHLKIGNTYRLRDNIFNEMFP